MKRPPHPHASPLLVLSCLACAGRQPPPHYVQAAAGQGRPAEARRRRDSAARSRSRASSRSAEPFPISVAVRHGAGTASRAPSDVIREANRKATEGPNAAEYDQRDHDLRLLAGDAVPDLHRSRATSPTCSSSPASTSSGSPPPATASGGSSRAAARRLGGTEQQHIYIKPTRPDLHTTLAVNTDRRSYILELRSATTTPIWPASPGATRKTSRAARGDDGAAAGPRRQRHRDGRQRRQAELPLRRRRHQRPAAVGARRRSSTTGTRPSSGFPTRCSIAKHRRSSSCRRRATRRW